MKGTAFGTGLVACGAWTLLMVAGPYNVGITLNQWLVANLALLGVLVFCFRKLRGL
jgi:hypothetical protein